MTNVVILGGNGKIAQGLLTALQDQDELTIQLFVRNPKKLDKRTELVFVGDATKVEDLVPAFKNADIIYSNLGPMNTDKMIDPVIEAMKRTQKKRIIWISTLGVYDEVHFSPEAENRLKKTGFIDQNKYVVHQLESSDLNYTIIRPNWITYEDKIQYSTYQKGELIQGNHVSQKSIIDFLITVLTDKTETYWRKSIGISDPKSPNL